MSEFAQLLFTWAIPHADDFGRMDGDPEVVHATVIPMKRERSPSDVECAIREWVEAGLVHWYKYCGGCVIQFITWEEHQTGLNKRTASKYPSLEESRTSERFLENPRNSSLTEQKRTELNGTEEEPKAEATVNNNVSQIAKDSSSSSRNTDTPNVFVLYQNLGFGQISELVKQKLEMYIDAYGEDWVSSAIQEAHHIGKHRDSTVKTILENWKTEGGMKITYRVTATGTRGSPVSGTRSARLEKGGTAEDDKSLADKQANFFNRRRDRSVPVVSESDRSP